MESKKSLGFWKMDIFGMSNFHFSKKVLKKPFLWLKKKLASGLWKYFEKNVTIIFFSKMDIFIFSKNF